MERVQILLETTEWQALKQLAEDGRTSMSEVMRDLLRERIKQHKREKLRRAAQRMAGEYRADPELTAFTALDGDEVLDASR